MSSLGPESGVRIPERSLLRAADRFRNKYRRELSLVLRARLRFGLAALLLLTLAAGVSIWTHARLRHVVHNQVRKVLLATSNAATEGASLWVRAARRTTQAAITDPELASDLVDCLSQEHCRAAEIEERADHFMRAAGFDRFRVADASGQVLLSGPVHSSATVLPGGVARHAARLGQGEIAILPPVPEDARAMMLVFAPIVDGRGRRLGTLLFDLPLEELTRVMRAARAGTTGETYAFDTHGRLLTESRFTGQLHRIGLLPETTPSAALAISVRDPGGDLTQGFKPSQPREAQPLTRMAADAVLGRSGCDVEGYRDYRGVPVLGAWRWLEQAGIGIATEVDREEGVRTLRNLQELFAWMVGGLGAVLLCSFVALALAARMHARAFAAERLAERFGQYRIVRKLAEGGMGRIYLADHELLRRPAAIKLLRPDCTTLDAIANFEREVQLTSTLTHPNTVAVYDYGRAEDGSLYYVMEYLEGLDLQRLIDHFGPLPGERVIHILRQLCGSLSEAHGAGLIHRDIKPANVLLCTRGGEADTLKVLDFGVAHVRGGARIHVASERILLGTPEYMAPEVFESANRASPESDLYAVGAVGYFLLTGTPPFDAETPEALCLAHLTQAPEPPSRRARQPIDHTLERALLLCLAKRREARPSSAEVLRNMLDRSALARTWNQQRAKAWWAQHAAEIVAAREADVMSQSAPPFRIRARAAG